MTQDPPTETKTPKIKRKMALSLAQKLVFFHVKYPNGCIQTEQLKGRDCICYKAVIIPDVKTPTRIFTGHCIAGLDSIYSIHKPSVIKKAENSAIDRAFHFMGVGLADDEYRCIIKTVSQAKPEMKKPAVCSICGRVWKKDKNGNNGNKGLLKICPECKMKKKIFSKIKIV
jgi:hypothetical protein